MMMPHFERYASEFKGKVAFVRINVLENIYKVLLQGAPPAGACGRNLPNASKKAGGVGAEPRR
jgi:hypothetical protein